MFGFQGSDDVEEGVSLRDSLKIYVYDVEEPVPGWSPVKSVSWYCSFLNRSTRSFRRLRVEHPFAAARS